MLAENPYTGEQEYKKVVPTFIHEKYKLVHITVGEEEIETSIEHPFYVEGVGFVPASELKAGDIIRTSEGENLPILKIEIELLKEPILAYNFEVEDMDNLISIFQKRMELSIILLRNMTMKLELEMFLNIRHLQKEQEQDKHAFLKIGQIVRLKRREILLLIYQKIRICQMVLLDMENMMG